jgi:hypothetical protein
MDSELLSSPVPNEQKVSKARKYLNSLTHSGHITKDGMSWLVLAADPWHDTKVDSCVGLPDESTGTSVVFPVTVENTIRKPTSLAAGNWSVRIHSNPVACYSQYLKSAQDGLRFTSNSATIAHMGPISLTYSNTSTFADMPGFDCADTPEGVVRTQELPSNYTKGGFRIIGMGFEVVNTTADLYRQGICTASRMNPTVSEPAFARIIQSPLNALSTARLIRKPPVSQAEQMLYDGVTQWHASEGCYCVVPISVSSNAVGQMAFAPLIQVGSDPSYLCYGAGSPEGYVQVLTNPGGGDSPGIPAVNQFFAPQERVCATFCGLSEQTTLTVRTRFIVERFPGPQESDMLVLAKTRAQYDPIALEFYTRAIAKLPPAVMFRENSSGEWWKRVLGQIAEIAGPLVSMLPYPVAKVASPLITKGGEMLMASANEDKARRKAKNAVNPAKAKNSKGQLKAGSG